jgi:hypothetical protein
MRSSLRWSLDKGEVMIDKRQLIPLAGLIATIALAIYTVEQLQAQAPALAGNFSNAQLAEVRDAQGQVILRGPFATVEEEDDDVERKATLTPSGSDSDAAGEAEVETSRATPAQQEIEFSIRNVAPGAVYTFAIDGQDVGTATADARGRAEFEIESQQSR